MQTTPQTVTTEPINTVDDSASGKHGKLYDPEGIRKNTEDSEISRFTAHDVGQGKILVDYTAVYGTRCGVGIARTQFHSSSAQFENCISLVALQPAST